MHRHLSPILLLLFGLAGSPAALAQSLPASMAYSSSILVRQAPADASQKLLIADNSLIQEHYSAFDLSDIPAAPDFVVRDSRISSSETKPEEDFANTSLSTTSKLRRSAALLGVLAIAYLATRRRPTADISEMRNFPKKRLAQHEAHA